MLNGTRKNTLTYKLPMCDCGSDIAVVSDSSVKVTGNFHGMTNHSIVLDRITSSQDRYKMVDVAHVNVTNNQKSKLFISSAPGRKDRKWNRDLETDLTDIKSSKINIVVCLLEWSELRLLNILNYPKRAQEKGLLFYHLPVKDLTAPSSKELNVLIPILVKYLSEGNNILVHCRAGLGRAGVICACCLIHFGLSEEKAIGIVRTQRPGAIQSNEQEKCIKNYYNNLLKRSKD